MWGKTTKARGIIIMSTTDDDDVKLHLQEADDLKKKWFEYVFASIQRLNDKIESSSLQFYKEKEELLKLLVDYRDNLLKVIQGNDIRHKEDLEKLRDNLDKIINDIKNKLGTLTNDDIELKLIIKTELAVLKQEFRDNLTITLKEHIEADAVRFESIGTSLMKIRDSQTILKTKVGVWVVVLSLLITALVTSFTGGMLVLFKNVIAAYLGVQ